MDKKAIALILIYIFCSIFGLLLLTYAIILLVYRKHILTFNHAPKAEYALVLGAGLEKNGKPSDILMDRIVTSVNLYKAGKAHYLVMSGSYRKNYDEPGAMQSAALELGVPSSAILLDRSGISTFNSCMTIKEKYNPEVVLIVSQQFHLPRSIMLQMLLGIKAFGIPAENYQFSFYKNAFWYFREILAMPYNFIKFAFYSH